MKEVKERFLSHIAGGALGGDGVKGDIKLDPLASELVCKDYDRLVELLVQIFRTLHYLDGARHVVFYCELCQSGTDDLRLQIRLLDDGNGSSAAKLAALIYRSRGDAHDNSKPDAGKKSFGRLLESLNGQFWFEPDVDGSMQLQLLLPVDGQVLAVAPEPD